MFCKTQIKCRVELIFSTKCRLYHSVKEGERSPQGQSSGVQFRRSGAVGGVADPAVRAPKGVRKNARLTTGYRAPRRPECNLRWISALSHGIPADGNVIPAQAGIPRSAASLMPAFAGMTRKTVADCASQRRLGSVLATRPGALRSSAPYCRAIAILNRSSGVIRWLWSSSPRSICTHSIAPVKAFPLGP